MKFHRPGCKYYNCSKCTVIFNSREEAIRAGYVPCKVYWEDESGLETAGPGKTKKMCLLEKVKKSG